jgi:hypothetical protein
MSDAEYVLTPVLDADLNSKTLYVFLHGLFSIVDHPYGLDVLMPFVAEHSYRVGPFLGETFLLPRPFDHPYQLHVPSGHKRFNPATNLAVADRLPDSACGPNQLHARIFMPLPYDIHYIRKVDLSAVLKDDHNLFLGKIAPLLIVLEYKFSDASEIRLEGHRYLAQCDPASGKTASLHILSEEDATASPGHKAKGFTAACQLFPDLKGKVSLANAPSLPPPLDLSEILPGTIRAEYTTLRERTEGAFTKLGSSLRAGGFPSMDFTPGAGSDIETCLNLVSSCR